MARDGGHYDHGLRDVPKPDARQEHQEQEAQRDFSEDAGGSRYSTVFKLQVKVNTIQKSLLMCELFFDVGHIDFWVKNYEFLFCGRVCDERLSQTCSLFINYQITNVAT